MAGKPRKYPKVRINWVASRGTDEDGNRYARLVWTPPGSGKEEYKTLGFVTAEVAEEFRETRQSALRVGVADPNDLSESWPISAVVTAYLDSLAERTNERYVTIETHRLGHVSVILGRIAVDRLNVRNVEKYAWTRHKEGARRNTITEEIAAMRRAIRTCKDEGKIAADPPPPTALKGVPQDARPDRRLTDAEVSRLIVTAGSSQCPGYSTLMQMHAWSGRRPIAVFGIRVRDCGRIVAPGLKRRDRLMYYDQDKGGRSLGWGPLTEPALEAVRARLAELGPFVHADQLLWPNLAGRMWNTRQFWASFQTVAERAEIADVQPYDLRRFACTRIVGQTRTLAIAIRYTGHESIQTLLRYVYDEVNEAEEVAGRIGWAPRLELVGDDAEEA